VTSPNDKLSIVCMDEDYLKKHDFMCSTKLNIDDVIHSDSSELKKIELFDGEKKNGFIIYLI
jgi:hypothetical protein